VWESNLHDLAVSGFLSLARLPVPRLRQHIFAGRFFGATLEQAKDGSELVSATEATTWIEFASAS